MFHQDIKTPRSGLNKRGAAKFFLTDLEVLGYLIKRSFKCLIWLLKLIDTDSRAPLSHPKII